MAYQSFSVNLDDRYEHPLLELFISIFMMQRCPELDEEVKPLRAKMEEIFALVPDKTGAKLYEGLTYHTSGLCQHKVKNMAIILSPWESAIPIDSYGNRRRSKVVQRDSRRVDTYDYTGHCGSFLTDLIFKSLGKRMVYGLGPDPVRNLYETYIYCKRFLAFSEEDRTLFMQMNMANDPNTFPWICGKKSEFPNPNCSKFVRNNLTNIQSLNSYFNMVGVKIQDDDALIVPGPYTLKLINDSLVLALSSYRNRNSTSVSQNFNLKQLLSAALVDKETEIVKVSPLYYNSQDYRVQTEYRVLMDRWNKHEVTPLESATAFIAMYEPILSIKGTVTKKVLRSRKIFPTTKQRKVKI